MTRGYRIRLFLAGAIAGCILVYFILIRGQNRMNWLPENRLKDQVSHSRVIFSEHAECIMKCRGISEETVNYILKNGDVNFGASDIHNTPCPSYAFDGTAADGQSIRVVCTACDSIAEVTTAIILEGKKDTCRCK